MYMNKKLTNREYQIAKLLCDGLTNAKISFKLDISKDTVKMHLKNMSQKYNAINRTNLAYILGKESII